MNNPQTTPFYQAHQNAGGKLVDFAGWMLREFHHQGDTVLVAHGSGFYATPGAGRDEARLAYVIAPDLLSRAAEVLGLGLEAYRSRRG